MLLSQNILQKLKLKLIGRNYFDPKSSIKLERHTVELWKGFLTAINPTESGIMLIADIAHKVIRIGMYHIHTTL